MQMFDRPLVFIHIPKTAGMTFLAFLESFLDKERAVRFLHGWQYVPGQWPPGLSDKQLISGHIPYTNIQPELPEANFLTFLRNPIEQVPSYYWQVRRRLSPAERKEHGAAPQLLGDFDEDMTLEEVIENKAKGKHSYIENIQLRFLGASGPVTSVAALSDAEWQQALERAKQRLIRNFAFFGICERMADSLNLFCSTFQLPYWIEGDKRHNARPAYQSSERPDAATEALICQQNQYDCALYEFATHLFQRRWGELLQHKRAGA